MDLRITFLFYILTEWCAGQIFQYFIVNNKEKTTKVIDTIKLPTCTHLDQKDNVTLRGGIKSGKFTKHGVVNNMNTCIDECCQDETCNVAFMPGTTCYTVSCYSEKLCESIPAIPSNFAVGGVQISHIIRNGGKGDDVDEFRKHSGVNRNSLPNGDNCVISRVAYNQSIVGGLQAGEIIDLGKLVDVRDCADKCCQHENCEVAVVRDNKCYAIDCFSKNLCDSFPFPSINGHPNMLVYMNKRNGKRQTRKSGSECEQRCVKGICANDYSCVCDLGWKGLLCDTEETKGKCDPVCGPHGSCNSNDTCTCEDGWGGYKCDHIMVCKPPCGNGICLHNAPRKCKCDYGWEGVYCNESLVDKAALASSGEEILFTDSEIEPELDIRMPNESPILHASESVSALAVAIGCGIAAAVLGTAAVMFIAKQILGKKTVSNHDYLSNIPGRKKNNVKQSESR